MSQKDMQAIKAPEPSLKQTEAKNAPSKPTSLMKPEAVKVDLPSMNPVRPERKPENVEQKKSLPAPAVKTRPIQPVQGSAVPDILSCMLKDTTSEHKAHLFDLKCKICTGQILATEDGEPAKKKPKLSVSKEKNEPLWKKMAGDDSPLRAPPDSPDMDSPTYSLKEPSLHFNLDSPTLTIVESPASPTMDSPASPTLESPASPIMESPASPTPETSKATAPKKAYTPVMIPAVSTVTITRRDPRTAASRFSASLSSMPGPSNTCLNQAAPYAPIKETAASHMVPATVLPPSKPLPKSILMKPSSKAEPRLYGTSSRRTISDTPADSETTQFLSKQDILWKGFLNMLTVAKFVTKGYLVSGSAENLKADLPDTIQIGGRIMPETVWDYVAKLKTSVTKELCVIRFHPATEEEDVAYISLFSYFSSRGRFGVIANSSRSIKDVYLVPLSAKEPIPSILQPLEGPGLEKNRPNLLLGLAVVQKTKRPGNLPLEIEEKRPKVPLSKDPMWIPKPPVLYGSDKLDMFKPYDPETPVCTTPPNSPSCPGSPSDSSSSGSITIPSLLTSIRAAPPVSTSATVTKSTPVSSSGKNPTTESNEKTPLQTILKTLFNTKQSESTISSDRHSTKTPLNTAKTIPVFSQVSGSMVDPIVQQYGQKSKVQEIEELETDFDRPYDPEEEYDPAMGYETAASKSTEKIEADDSALLNFPEDDVAYDPEDETIFEDFQSDSAVTRPPATTELVESSSRPTLASTSTPEQTSTQATVAQTLPTGAVVVSAATLSEQQRMLEELNKQIEEQKRQLKEQEEALRQQREAVGMFMAQFTVSDSLMPPPQKSLPLSQLSSLQKSMIQTESKPTESTEKTALLSQSVDNSNLNSQTDTDKDLKNDTNSLPEQDETQKNVEEYDKYSSAGEIQDSDIAYDPEDESLFNEIQEDVFKGETSEHRASHKGMALDSYHSRRRRSSPKKRSHRERERYRSPSRRSRQRSRSLSRRHRDRERHRRSENDRSRHTAREPSDRQGRHHKDHTPRRHSRGRKRSPNSSREKGSLSISPKRHRKSVPQVTGKSKQASDPCNASVSCDGPSEERRTSSSVVVKNERDEQQLKCSYVESSEKQSKELLHNVKHDLPEQSVVQEQDSVSDQDNNVTGGSANMNEPFHQENLINSKIESTIPVREIDPPIRDSPQSPDPEPQFVKPNTIENNDSIKMEDSEKHTSVSVPFAKVKTEDQGGGHSHLSTTFDIQGQELKIEPMIKQSLLSMSGSSFNLGTDMKQSGHVIPQEDLKETRIKFPGPDEKQLDTVHNIGDQSTDISCSWPATRASAMRNEKQYMAVQDINQEINSSNVDISLNVLQALPNSYMRESNVQIERDRPGSDERGSGSADFCLNTTEHVLQPENKYNKPGVMKNGIEQPFRGPQSESVFLDVRNSDQSIMNSKTVQNLLLNIMGCSQDADTHTDITNTDLRSQGPRVGGPDVVDQESLNKALSPHTSDSERNFPKLDRDDWRVSHRRESGPLRERLFVQDDQRYNQTDRRSGPNREIHPLDRSSNGGLGFRQPESEMRDSNTQDWKHNRRELGSSSFMGPRTESRGPDMEFPMHDRRGPGNPDFRGPWSERRNLDMVDTGPHGRGPDSRDFRETGLERRGVIMDSNMTDRRAPGPDNRGTDPESRGLSMEDSGSNRRVGVPELRGPGFTGPGSENKDSFMHGPGPERRRPGSYGSHFSQPGPDSRGPAMSVGPDRNVLGGLDVSELGHQQRSHFMDRREPDRRGPTAPERRAFLIDEPVSDRRELGEPNPGGLCPERKGSAGPERTAPGMGGPGLHNRRQDRPHIRDHGQESDHPNVESPGSSRRGPEFHGPRFARPSPDMENRVLNRSVLEGPRRGRPGPIIKGPDLGRRGSEGPDCRESGTERSGPNIEGPGTHWRNIGRPDFSGQGNRQEGDWEKIDDWGESEHIQEHLDIRGPDAHRVAQNVRGRRPMRRGSGHNFRGSAPNRGGTDNDKQWSDGREREPNMQFDRDHSDDWERHDSGNLDDLQEGQEEQDHAHSFQGPCREWRGPGRNGPGAMQQRPNMPFQGPKQDPGDSWNSRGCSAPRRSRGGRGNDRRSMFFTGELDRDNRTVGPGSDMQRNPDMKIDNRHPDVRVHRTRPNLEGPGSHRRGSGLMNSGPNRREREMEDFDRRPPGGPPKPGNQNSNIERQGYDGRVSDCREQGFESLGAGLENSGPDRQEFEQGFRRERSGPRMTRPGLDKTDMRGPPISQLSRGPIRCTNDNMMGSTLGANSEMQVSNCRGPSMSDREPGQRGPQSGQYNQALRPGPNGSPQNQQAVRSQRLRGALLPTPTEGLVRIPNIRGKPMSRPVDREEFRGRPGSRERGSFRGRRRVGPIDRF